MLLLLILSIKVIMSLTDSCNTRVCSLCSKTALSNAIDTTITSRVNRNEKQARGLPHCMCHL